MWGREYLGRDEKFGYWRDTHLCIEGAAVTSLAVRFVLDWKLCGEGEPVSWRMKLFEIPQYVRNGRDPVPDYIQRSGFSDQDDP